VTVVRVCGVGDVPAGEARRFDLDGCRLAVVRVATGAGTGTGDEWFAIDDRCTHAEASLAEGPVWADDCEIECPRHGSTFDLRTGKPLTLPATRPAVTYAVRVDGDDVMVDLP